MKVSRKQFAKNRQRILDVAGRLFRERGFDGISVADLMKAAGLTHGGFYGHFESKEDLVAQACAKVLSGSANGWARIAAERPDDAARAIVEAYLSPKHRDQPGIGCAFATLGGEVARQAKPVRQAFTEGIRARLEVLAGVVTGRSKAAQRQKALATMSGLVGAMVLARAVDDPAFSGEILAAAAAAFGGQAGQGAVAPKASIDA
jgi:TetR/AcrR family transcriptional repressor of nem operon